MSSGTKATIAKYMMINIKIAPNTTQIIQKLTLLPIRAVKLIAARISFYPIRLKSFLTGMYPTNSTNLHQCWQPMQMSP
jgi:hypothetical protein